MLVELAAAVRNGKVSPLDLVEESLRRIERSNPGLNAVVALRAEEALEEARNHDRRGALAGVPVLVKDLEDVAGMRTTFGSLLYADAPPATSDGVVPARLRAAGAIVVGKTNTPDHAWTGYTWNRVFGVTRNPWNAEMSTGGSSGGSGAAVSAGLAPVASGSDGGGSVRIPAAETGLLGWKPSFAGVGREGTPMWLTFSTNGVMQTNVADLVVEGGVIQGPTPGDLFAVPGRLAMDPLRPARVVAIPTFKTAVDGSVRAAFERTCGVIADGLKLPSTHVDRVFDVAPDPATGWLLIAGAELAAHLAWAEDREDELDPGLKLFVTMGKYVEARQYVDAQRNRFVAARQIDALIGNDGVLVLPTTNAADWPAAGPFPTSIDGQEVGPMDSVNTMELNYTGHPVVTVPIGVGASGVPIGMQIVAPRGRDQLAIGLAAAIEEAQPWQRHAPGYDAFPLP